MAEHKKSNKGLVCVLILVSILLVVVPFLALRGAEFGGSDDAGSQMVNEVTGTEYEPWFTPVLENLIVGILAFCFGYLVARKKYSRGQEE